MLSFVDGASCALDRAALAALSDLGLTAEQIARYFSVDAAAARGSLNSQA